MISFRIVLVFVVLGLLSNMFANAAHAEKILDGFESGTIRTYGSNSIWANYGGEGANATVSVQAGAAKEGTYGLRYRLNGGTAYMHFYPNNGSVWSFARERNVDSGWTNDTYNRMSFWIYTPSTFPSAGGNGKNIEFGTYVRCSTCDTATQNDGGTHYYHYYNLKPGVWSLVVLDWHPQHFVGGPTSDPGVRQYPTTTGSGFNYFDALTRSYWNSPYDNPSAYPADWYFDSFKFYTDSNANEDLANIASLEASYNPTTNQLHVGFVRNSADDTVYTARYHTGSMHTAGFAAGTLMGTAGVDGEGDYVNKHIDAAVDLDSAVGVYIAVQKQGSASSVFREIYLPIATSSDTTPPTAPTGLGVQ